MSIFDDLVCVRLWKDDNSVDLVVFGNEYLRLLDWCSQNDILLVKMD